MSIPIQSPKVGTALQAAFGLQGRVRPYLEESIIPTVLVGSLEQGTAPYIRRHATARFTQAAVGGAYGGFRLEAIPGTIAVIRRIELRATAAGIFGFNFPGNAATITAFGNTASKSYTDGRILTGSPGGGQAPASVLTYGTKAAALASYASTLIVAANAAATLTPDGWVIGTGSSGLYGFLECQFGSVAIAVDGCVEWDEYQAV